MLFETSQPLGYSRRPSTLPLPERMKQFVAYFTVGQSGLVVPFSRNMWEF